MRNIPGFAPSFICVYFFLKFILSSYKNLTRLTFEFSDLISLTRFHRQQFGAVCGKNKHQASVLPSFPTKKDAKTFKTPTANTKGGGSPRRSRAEAFQERPPSARAWRWTRRTSSPRGGEGSIVPSYPARRRSFRATSVSTQPTPVDPTLRPPGPQSLDALARQGSRGTLGKFQLKDALLQG